MAKALLILALLAFPATAAAATSVGGFHTLELNAGIVTAWGNNGYGQIGDGHSLLDGYAYGGPVVVLEGAVAVSAGLQRSTALMADGTVVDWGDNEGGQLGHFSRERTPAELAGTGIFERQEGEGRLPVEVCAVGEPELRKDPGSRVDAFGCVKHLENVVAISQGSESSHTLAVLQDGTVVAWGRNDQGQLGDGTRTHRAVPVVVAGLIDVSAVAAGTEYSLARKDDGTIWAWGRGYGLTPVEIPDEGQFRLPITIGGEEHATTSTDSDVGSPSLGTTAQYGIGSAYSVAGVRRDVRRHRHHHHRHGPRTARHHRWHGRHHRL